ncbi:MAG: helix-turn-helix transcriptional regulator [Eubacteriales bacterium]|jgi:predicted DNA-binding transcriptional regulator YafY
MYTKQPKKLLIMNILDILKKYSDADHKLSQKNIMDILQKEYEMTADRKAIKRNLMNLMDFGYNIEYTERTRINKNGEEETIYTDWYLEREFSDPELRLLIDSLLFSMRLPYSHCKELIKKLEGLSSQCSRSKDGHIRNLPLNQPENAELFYTIEILDEAIEKACKVAFLYADYGIDKKLHPRFNDSGEERIYTVNPYQMAAINGRYYLIGNYDKYDNVSHYRIDRIRNIKLLKERAKPKGKVKGLENGLNLPQYMAEHIYMFSGESALVTLRAEREMVGELVDWFGSSVIFCEEEGGGIRAEVFVDLEAMRFWALQHAPYVTVLSPDDLVNRIKQDLVEAVERYEEIQLP